MSCELLRSAIKLAATSSQIIKGKEATVFIDLEHCLSAEEPVASGESIA